MKIGGQAVLEGVMIKSKRYYATAVRNEKGKIVTQVNKLKNHPKWFNYFFIRGITNLIEMLFIGMKSLTWSANQISDEEDEKLTDWQIFLTVAVAIVFALGIFVALPYILSLFTGVSEEGSPVLFNLIDGIIKVIIFFLYLYLISLMKEIRRVFEYHGAEHKTVYCFEAGKKLTVKNTKKYPTEHPRCGTSFLFLVIVIAIFIFTLIPVILLAIFPNFTNIPFFLRKIILFFLRIAFIPVVAGLSFELLKFSAKFQDKLFGKIISYPGILFQHITTREPDNKQIEVAIKAATLVLKKEGIKF